MAKDLNIKYVPVNDLIPYVNNARKHSDKQINQIAASIKEFGFNNPVLTDGNNGIIAGHGRADNVITYKTLRDSGYTGEVYFITGSPVS